MLTLVKAGKHDVIANIIIHARTDMYIRSMPIVMTVQFAEALRIANKTYPALRTLVRDVIQRADQITDLYAVALSTFGGKKFIPTAIKNGVADAFLKFNAYQIEKYNRAGAVKLRDVLQIVHPKAKTKLQGELFSQIITDTVPTPYTWETELSINGTLPADKKKTDTQLWTELVSSGKLGYMALLRNLRNIITAGVDADLQARVIATLTDPEEIAKNKQLPFRYINAQKAITGSGPNWLRAINNALNQSFVNVPKIGENVWIIIDCSGSMEGGYSTRQTGTAPIDTAVLFAAALVKANADSANVRVTMFSNNAEHVDVNPDDTVTSIAAYLRGKVYGGGTALQSALNLKSKLGFEPDTVVVLSDMQVDRLDRANPSSYFTNECVKVAINLDAYESTPIGDLNGWFQLSGFSERLFDMIPAMREQGSVAKRFNHAYEPAVVKIPYDLQDKKG